MEKPQRIALLAILGLTALTYFPMFDAGFVFDSRFIVLQDQRVHEWSAENLRKIFQFSYWWPIGESGLYRPVTTLSVLVNYLFSGENAAGYHAVNLALHLLNVFLVFLLCKAVTSSASTAVWASALWAVIPLGAEAVANVAGRADLLSTAFVLAGFLCYVRAGLRRNYKVWLVALFVCLTLAVFTKESAIILAPVIAAHVVIAGHDRSRLPWLPLLCALAVPIVLLIVTRFLVLGHVLAPSVPFVDNPIAHASWLSGRLTALRVVGEYLQLLVWPHPLFADYSYPQAQLAAGTAADMAGWLAVLIAVALAWYHRRRLDVSMGFLIAVIAILPVSNILFTIGTIKAERLMYLPSIGLCLVIAVIARTIPARGRAKMASHLVLGALVICWSARTHARTYDWQSDITLWQSAVANGTESAKAHRALAEALYASDPTHANLPIVIDHMRKAADLVGDLPLALRSAQEYRQLAAYNLDQANVLPESADRSRFYREALNAAAVALDIVAAKGGDGPAFKASLADLHRLRAVAGIGLGRYAEGLQDARLAIELDIFSEHAFLLAADALLAQRDPDAAAQQLVIGGMVLQSSRLSDELIKLYRATDPGGCALNIIGGVTVVNPQCPVVRRHLCEGAAQAIRLLQTVERTSQAKELAVRATQNLGCV